MDAWLNPETPLQEALNLLRPNAEHMEYYSVSPKVGSVKYNDPACVKYFPVSDSNPVGPSVPPIKKEVSNHVGPKPLFLDSVPRSAKNLNFYFSSSQPQKQSLVLPINSVKDQEPLKKEVEFKFPVKKLWMDEEPSSVGGPSFGPSFGPSYTSPSKKLKNEPSSPRNPSLGFSQPANIEPPPMYTDPRPLFLDEEEDPQCVPFEYQTTPTTPDGKKQLSQGVAAPKLFPGLWLDDDNSEPMSIPKHTPWAEDFDVSVAG